MAKTEQVAKMHRLLTCYNFGMVVTYLICFDCRVFQKLKFQSAISWHYHDVDMELSPPSEIT